MSTFSVHQMFPLCPLADPTMPVTRASTAHQAGIHRTSAGQQVPVLRAMNAHTLGLILGKRLHKGGMKENIKILRVT